jgi:predicted NBD/HSP70 family sugar kinase
MNTTNQMDEIRRQNRANILACLRTHSAMSRTGIAARTGLSAATISTITADMLANGILLRAEEANDPAAGRGRPRVNLSFNPAFSCVGVIVFQLNQIFVSIVDYSGQTIYSNEIPLVTTSISTEDLLDALVNALRTGLENVPDASGNLKHVSVCVQGTTDVSQTTMLWSPIVQTRNIPISQHLGMVFGVTVSVHNDCNIVAKALRYKEPDFFKADFAAIVLSHGIGIGLFQNGELVKGRNSSGTEFGHMTYIPGGALCRCGRLGCIEAYASEYGIYRNAKNLKQDTAPQDDIKSGEMDKILALAHANDPLAIASFEMAGAAIGTGLANLFALIDPFPVAIVGAGAKARDHLENIIRKSICGSNMHSHTEQVPILFYHDENPFLREGCALAALSEVDEHIASNQPRRKVTEIAY